MASKGSNFSNFSGGCTALRSVHTAHAVLDICPVQGPSPSLPSAPQISDTSRVVGASTVENLISSDNCSDFLDLI